MADIGHICHYKVSRYRVLKWISIPFDAGFEGLLLVFIYLLCGVTKCIMLVCLLHGIALDAHLSIVVEGKILGMVVTCFMSQ